MAVGPPPGGTGESEGLMHPCTGGGDIVGDREGVLRALSVPEVQLDPRAGVWVFTVRVPRK